MAEKMNGARSVVPWSKGDGLYSLSSGHYFYVNDGVLHLPVQTISAPAVLAKRKPLIMMSRRGAGPVVFMRAADMIESWPHVERQVRNTAAALGLAL